jgi:5-methylcytosine-specific restriction endonuclease McrA
MSETFYSFVTRRVGKIMLGYSYDMMMHDRVVLSNKRFNSYKLDKRRLWIAQNGICHWCKCQCNLHGTGGTPTEFTVDHIISLNAGGTNHWRNLVGSCHKCNNQRGCYWTRNYQLIEIERPSERIVWSDWLNVTPIYE